MARLLNSVCIALFTFGIASAQDVDPLTSNQWVQPAEAGTFSGRVILPSGDGLARAVEGASVTLYSVDGGGVTGEAVTDGMGEFTITGVTPGVYTISSRAANAYSHLSIHVIDSSVDLDGRFPNVAEISAANMSYDAVQTAVSRYRPPSNKRVITMADADLDALASRTINADTFRVSQLDGGLNGWLYAAGAEGPNLIPAAMTNVFIMKNGVEVGRAVTDELGDFRIDDLPVGNYSLLAVGRDGLAAIGFELVAKGADVAKRTADGQRLVSLAKPVNSFRCQLGPFADKGEKEGDGKGRLADGGRGSFINRNSSRGGKPPHHSGGKGGGGGGLGAVAGLAGIGGIIAAASSGNNNGLSIQNPPTASDFLPTNQDPGSINP